MSSAERSSAALGNWWNDSSKALPTLCTFSSPWELYPKEVTHGQKLKQYFRKSLCFVFLRKTEGSNVNLKNVENHIKRQFLMHKFVKLTGQWIPHPRQMLLPYSQGLMTYMIPAAGCMHEFSFLLRSIGNVVQKANPFSFPVPRWLQ